MVRRRRVEAPVFADVLDAYIEHVVRALFPEDAQVERKLRNYVVNLQKEDAGDDQIYDAIEELDLCPGEIELGNPLAFYEAFVEKHGLEAKQAAEKASKKAEREAKKAAQAARTGFSNKRRCVELEQQMYNKQVAASELTTVSVTPTTLHKRDSDFGNCVQVSPDLAPGKCSHGGSGFVLAVDGDGESPTFTVEHDESAAHEAEKQSAPEPVGIAAILSRGHSSNRGYGWRAKDLGLYEDNRKKTQQFKSRMREDAKELQGYITAMHSYNRTRATRGQSILNNHTESRSKGRFKKRKAKYNPISMAYLAKAWGVGRNFPTELRKEQTRKEQTDSSAKKPSSPVHLPVISSLAATKVKYSPRNMYIMNRVRERKEAETHLANEDNDGNASNAEVYREEAKAEWCLLSNDKKTYWEQRSRCQIAAQPFIADQIIESLQANPARSYDKVAEDIGNWCSASTIQRWFKSQEGCARYAERAGTVETTF